MPKLAANLSMLFNEVDFLDRFAAAAKAGFKGVEYLFPYDWKPKEIKSRLDKHGLTQVLFNLPPGDWDAGERGIACIPGRTDEFKAGMETAAKYAQALGCTQLHCMAGVAPKGVAHERARETYLENLAWAAPVAESAGARLLIEAINTRDMPGYFLNTSAQAAAVLDDLGSDNVWFQNDLYHLQVMEGDLARTIEAMLARTAHVQIAGNPGRREPDSGEINHRFLLGWLDALGYKGWVGCEYKPAAATEDGLGWARPYL
ncbi:MAG: 2-oxo-tetronate isomerase [Rhodospirillales bacterium]